MVQINADGESTAFLKRSSVTKICCTLVLKSQHTSRNFSDFRHLQLGKKSTTQSIPAADKGQSPSTTAICYSGLPNKAKHDYTLNSHAVKELMHFLQLAFLSYYYFPSTPHP